MKANVEPGVACKLHGAACVGPRVAAVDGLQRGVVGAFGSILHYDLPGAVDLCERSQNLLIYAVGASADNQSLDAIDAQSLLVEGKQTIDRGMGVGVGLEIGEIAHLGIFAGEKALARFELRRDRAVCA